MFSHDHITKTMDMIVSLTVFKNLYNIGLGDAARKIYRETYDGDVHMHEWALAEAVITTALDVAKKEHLKKITKITVQLGEMQQINEEIFRYALNELVELHKKQFNKATIDINIEKTMLQCNHCKHKWQFGSSKGSLGEDEAEAIHFIPEVALVHTRCPNCGSPDFCMMQGRGVSLSSIQGVKE